MKTLFKYAFKELINNKGFSIFFSVNLTVGLLGFIFLFTAGDSIKTYFDQNLRNFFLADFKVHSRGTPPENLKQIITEIIPAETERTETIEFFSMIAGTDTSQLFNVHAVQDNFPLYGKFEIDGSKVTKALINKQLLNSPGIWLDDTSQIALGIKPGDSVKIGSINFTVAGTVTHPLSPASGFVGMMRNVYIGYPYAEKTGLIQFGSRVTYETYFKVSPDTDYKIQSEQLSKLIEEKIEAGEETTVSVRTVEGSGERMSTITDYITGFLNLINLIALFLAGVGSYYLYKGYARQRQKFNAVAMCIGLIRSEIYAISIIQLTMLSVTAFMLAVLTSISFSGLISQVISVYLNNFQINSINPGIFLLCFFITICFSLIFTLPILVKYKDVKPMVLFSERHQIHNTLSGKLRVYTYLPIFVSFWGIASYYTSLTEGSIFILIFTAALSVIVGLGLLMIYLVGKTGDKTDAITRIARRNLSRHKEATISAFTAIAAGAFLISTIPQISNGIKQEIETPDSNVLPEYFLFDIQPEQRPKLESWLESKKLTLSNVSPMVRARLTAINGVSVTDENLKKTFKNQAKNIMRRGMNLSYRKGLYASEMITEGKILSDTYDDALPAEISLETKFADNLGVTVGDNLTFLVQGITVDGVIKNLRRVRWNSFQPNFFISFQTGVLEDAPQTFIGNINNISGTDKLALKRELSRLFPNISVIDVTLVVENILDIANKALMAVQFLSVLAILSGLLVIFLIAIYETREKIPEFALLKIVGCELRQLRKIVFYELALPGILSTLLGIGLSIAAALSISIYFFNSLWALSLGWIGFIFLAICSVIVIICFSATEKVIRVKPHVLISDAD